MTPEEEGGEEKEVYFTGDETFYLCLLYQTGELAKRGDFSEMLQHQLACHGLSKEMGDKAVSAFHEKMKFLAESLGYPDRASELASKAMTARAEEILLPEASPDIAEA